MNLRGQRPALGAAGALALALAGAGLISAAAGLPGGSPGSPQGSVTAIESVVVAAAVAAAAEGGAAEGAVAGRIAVSPITVRLELVPRKPKSKGPAEVRATITNLSAAKLSRVEVSIGASPGSLAIRPAASSVIHSLGAGRSVEAAWTICSTTGGTFLLTASATVSGVATASPPMTVTLASSARC